MKYELLKRTAIALFVGGVISSYTVAAEQPAISTNSISLFHSITLKKL